MYLLRTQELGSLPDPNTDPRLLPGFLQQGANDGQMGCYRTALRVAMEQFLTPEQKQALHMRFWQERSMAEIASEMGISPSGASKRVNAALDILRQQVDFCVQVYTELEKPEAE